MNEKRHTAPLINFLSTLGVVVALLLCPYLLPAQSRISIQYFGKETGLPHRQVNAIVKDQSGLLWVATPKGVSTFDGYQFCTYTQPDLGLQYKEVHQLMCDTKGRMWLWYLSEGQPKVLLGIDLWGPLQGKVIPFAEGFSSPPPFPIHQVIRWHQNQEGVIAFWTRSGELWVYGEEGFVSYPIQAPKGFRVQDIYLSGKGACWMSGNNSEYGSLLAGFQPNGQALGVFPMTTTTQLGIYGETTEGVIQGWALSPKDSVPMRFFEIKEGQTYVPKKHLTQKWNRQFPAIPQWIYKIKMDSEGPFLLVKSRDLYGKGQLDLWNTEADEVFPLNKSDKAFGNTQSMYTDDSGQWWIGTDYGLYQIEMLNPQIKKWLHNKGGVRSIRGITQDYLGRIWAATEVQEEGIWIIDEKLDTAWTISELSDDILSTEGHQALLKSRKGNIWYKEPDGFMEVNPNTVKSRRHAKGGHYSNWSLFEDRQGQIWIGQSKGRLGYLTDGQFHLLPPLDTLGEVYHIYQFLPDPHQQDRVWVSTDAGLFILDTREKKILQRYWAQGKGVFHLPFQHILHIHIDKEDATYWLATHGHGLIHWSPEQGVIERFTEGDDLSDNTVYAVYEDENHQFWLPTDRGITRFDKHSHQTRFMLEYWGLEELEFNRIAHYEATDGTLYFGSMNGLVRFHPLEVENEVWSFDAPMTITRFQQLNGAEKMLVDKTSEVKQNRRIVIQPGDGFFRLDFALLCYHRSDRIRYAYKMEGIEEQWQFQEAPFLHMGGLPYGDYVLRIRGQGRNGVWSSRELTLPISVIRPFYLKKWFVVSAAMGLPLLIFFLITFRIRSLALANRRLESEVADRTRKIEKDIALIAQQAEELAALDKTKSRFFANVSHELRTPLTTLLGSLQMVIQPKKSDDEDLPHLKRARQSGKELLRLVSSILELSKMEAQKMELQEAETALQPLLRRIAGAFESHADRTGVTFLFDYRAEPGLILYLDAPKLTILVNNLLSNAFKFTSNGGRVSLTTEDLGSVWQIQVEDTGRGVHPEDLPHIFDRFFQSKQANAPTEGGTGIGLALVKEYVELMEGTIEVQSEWGAGSRFTLQFPKKEVLSTAARKRDFQASVESKKVGQGKKVSSYSKGIPRKPCILIVEDNDNLRDYLSSLLQSRYRVLMAEHGQQALELLQNPEMHCDLILSDLMMPVLDGLQLLEHIKADERLSALPFLMLTARTDQTVKLQALRIGVDDYLTKPFREDELLVRIQNLQRRYALRQKAVVSPSPASLEKEASEAETNPSEQLIWLEELETFVKAEVQNDLLSVSWLAQQMHLSERQLHRRIKSLTGLTPNLYIREVRLQKARRLMERGEVSTVKAAADHVCFRDEKYFSRVFKKRFGAPPSNFLS